MYSKGIRHIVAALAVMGTVVSFSVMADGTVIVNQRNPADIKVSDIKNLYLGNTSKIDGERIVPVMTNDKDTRNQFIKNVLNTSATRYRANWAKRVFTNRSMPPQEYPEEEVLKMVGDDEQVMGVVSDNKAITEQKIVHNF